MKKYDNKKQVDIAILDFSKAFDVVPHRKLLMKLEQYGIQGHLLEWIGNFLQQRTQTVVVEGQRSTSVRVASGVPQGTCLGPILFLTYINDITANINGQLRLFADDALLYSPINSLEDQIKLQNDLHTPQRWATTLIMVFNLSKCYILSTSRHSDPVWHFITQSAGKSSSTKQKTFILAY